MKKLTTIQNTVIVVFLMITTLTFSQKLEKIKGSKIVTLSEIILDSISTIELYKNINLTLKQSDNVRFAIYADDNLHDVVDLDIDGGKLSVSLLRRITSKKKFELTLYINDLSKIILNDNSTLINNDFFETNDISIVLNNKSDFKCLFDADVITFEGNDTSKSETNFRAKTINYSLQDRAKIKGISNAEITKIKSVGKNLVTISGKSDETFINVGDTSTLKLSNLISNVTELKAQDKSSVYVLSKEDMSIYAKDDASIYIYGNCDLDLIEFKGTANLYKKDK
jgi:hypothetical protein